MLSEALAQMLGTLGAFLPPPPTGGVPAPDLSVVRLQEKAIGLGRFHALEERHFFPVVHKGLRLEATVRFQLWGNSGDPGPLGDQVRDLTTALLDDRESLERDGFIALSLTSVSPVDHISAAAAWRQFAEFDVLYEFRRETSDLAGGLIAQLPVELAEEWGSMLVTGDVTVWDGGGTPPLSLQGRRAVHGLSTLEFLQTPAPAGAVTITRTMSGVTGPPDAFATLDSFLAAVAGPTPTSTHARATFPTLQAFLDDIGTPGDPIQLVDANGAPRGFPARGRVFDLPIDLTSTSDVLEVAFEASALAADQVLYLRAVRGRTNSP